MLKYISKPPNFVNLEQYAQYLNAIKGVRRLHRYGIFYGFKVLQDKSIKCPYCGGDLKYDSTASLFYHTGVIIYSEILQQVEENEKNQGK